MLEIPVWGRVEEAADNVTALIMLDFGEELAWTTLLGSAWYLAQRGMLGTGFFSDAARPLEAQRFYNYLCFAYGAQPKTYEFLVNGFNLPERPRATLPRGVSSSSAARFATRSCDACRPRSCSSRCRSRRTGCRMSHAP